MVLLFILSRSLYIIIGGIIMNGHLTTLEQCVIVGVLIYLTIEVIVWIKYIM
jgi:hypothetical protein